MAQISDSPARVIALAALGGTQLESDIVVAQTVGGIQAGTFYAAGTSTSVIISDLLNAAPTNVSLYIGATTNIPASKGEEGLTLKEVLNTVLLNTENGYELNIKAGLLPPQSEEPIAQYPVIALPKGYTILHWYPSVLSLDIPHTMVYDSTNQYNIYYLNDKSLDVDLGGCDYRIFVKYTAS